MAEKETFMVYSSVAFINAHTSSDPFMLNVIFFIEQIVKNISYFPDMWFLSFNRGIFMWLLPPKTANFFPLCTFNFPFSIIRYL